MKKIRLLSVLAFMAAALSLSFTIGGNEDPAEDGAFEMVSIAELKALYGAENISLGENGALLSDTDVILVNANPCGPGSINQPCEQQLALNRRAAQKRANECCCIQGYGAICCDRKTGAFLAIDAIVFPNDPSCE